jgi:mono/diheme cytochrome c family protein
MRYKPALSAVIVIAALVPAVAEERLHVYDPVLGKQGAQAFHQYCAACHGVSARGDGPTAESLKTRPADLTAIAKRRGGTFPSREIAQFIDGRAAVAAHGSRDMPVWGERFAEEARDPKGGETIARGNIASLVEYLRWIQKPPLPSATPPQKH